jgi:phosphocarrier protein
MKVFNYTIADKSGIHARPAGVLVKKANEFESKITIEKDSNAVSLTNLMAVMSLGAKFGETVTITIDGADEDIAVQSIKALLEEIL